MSIISIANIDVNEGLACLEEMGAQEVYPSPARISSLTLGLSTSPIPTSSGKPVIKDQDEAIVFMHLVHILIDSGGELHAGVPSALPGQFQHRSVWKVGRSSSRHCGYHATLGSDAGRLSIEERKETKPLVQEITITSARSQSRSKTDTGNLGELRGTRKCILFTVAQVWTSKLQTPASLSAAF